MDQHVMKFLNGWVIMEDGQIDPSEVFFSKEAAAKSAQRKAQTFKSDLVIHDGNGTTRMRNN